MTTTPGGRIGGGTVEVVLVGELDMATAGDAARQIEQAETTGPDLLVIDLSRLEFIDSSGVRLVLLAQERARVGDRRVAVRLGSGPARRVFQALGLLDRLDVLAAPS